MAKSKWPILLPPARRDVKKGYDWYEEQRPGLGDVFLERVEECLAAIRRSPKAFQPVAKDARRAIVKQFPYVVFFRIEGQDDLRLFGISYIAESAEMDGPAG